MSRTALNLGVAGLVVAGALAVAAPASAENVFLSDHMAVGYVPAYAVNNNNPADVHFLQMAPQVVTMNDGTVVSPATQDLLAWCLQPFVALDLNFNWNTMSNDGRAYGDGDVLSHLSSEDRDSVGRLVNFGSSLFNNWTIPDIQALANIQGAIWQIVASDYTFYQITDPAYTPFDFMDGILPTAAQLDNSGITALVASAPTLPVSPTFRQIEALDLGSQGLAITLAVPEPATWGMMIIGFFSAGSLLRARRRLAA